MKHKLKVKNLIDNSIQESDFDTSEQAYTWLELGKEKGWWGAEARTIEHPETVDEDGNVILGRTETIPATYTFEIIDNSAKIEAEKAKHENKKNKRDQRIVKLKTLDWNKVKTIADLKDVVEALANEILKDEE